MPAGKLTVRELENHHVGKSTVSMGHVPNYQRVAEMLGHLGIACTPSFQ
jgi:hypothetical protein